MAGLRLDHVAILVRNFDAALARFKRLLRVEDSQIIVARGLEDGEDVVDAAFIDLGGARIEVFAPAKPGGAMERALERRGEGLHHVCFSTDDLDGELSRLREEGVELVDAEPRVDRFGVRYFYVHPKEAHRTLVCFIERWEPTGPCSWRPLGRPPSEG